MAISSIDDLLMGGGGNSLQPDAPENQYQDEPEPIQELDQDAPEYEDEQVPELDSNDEESIEQDSEELEEKPRKQEPKEYDEYGNEKEPENKEIRERLARQARKHQEEIDALRAQLAQQGASREVQQAAKDFEYNPDEGGDWQQQLASFVKQTVNSMTREQQEVQTRQEDAKLQSEFEGKFREGMSKFGDFVETIGGLSFEITNPMTLATRAMENPAAFLYAAAKRNPQELERISKIRDPYAQMTKMDKLEERMRKNKPSTKAPRPLGRTPEDSHSNTPKKKTEANGDDLLARADAKRLATVKTRLRGNR
jgi:hypothetical protein